MAETPEVSSWHRRVAREQVDRELAIAQRLGWHHPSLRYTPPPTGPLVSENSQSTSPRVHKFKVLKDNPILEALQESFYDF